MELLIAARDGRNAVCGAHDPPLWRIASAAVDMSLPGSYSRLKNGWRMSEIRNSLENPGEEISVER